MPETPRPGSLGMPMTRMAAAGRGFTLIEVLIVLFIGCLAVGMAAPALFRTYEKIEAQSELKILEEVLRNVSMACVLCRTEARVEFSGSRVVVLPFKDIYPFKRIDFPDEVKLTVNAQGVPDRNAVQVRVGDALQTLPVLSYRSGVE